jgi:Ca2+-binding EF-hand superfamily protein
MLKDREEFARRLNAADKDKNGKLSRDESEVIPKLHDNFDAIDTNHDGQLVIKKISDYLRAQLEAQKTASKYKVACHSREGGNLAVL